MTLETPVACPVCGSSDITAALVDRHITAEDLVAGPIDRLTYGYVATCNTCGHRWKPDDDGHAADCLLNGDELQRE